MRERVRGIFVVHFFHPFLRVLSSMICLFHAAPSKVLVILSKCQIQSFRHIPRLKNGILIHVYRAQKMQQQGSNCYWRCAQAKNIKARNVSILNWEHWECKSSTFSEDIDKTFIHHYSLLKFEIAVCWYSTLFESCFWLWVPSMMFCFEIPPKATNRMLRTSKSHFLKPMSEKQNYVNEMIIDFSISNSISQIFGDIFFSETCLMKYDCFFKLELFATKIHIVSSSSAVEGCEVQFNP